MRRSAIMVDVDGVIIVHPEAVGWTTNLDRDLGISVADIQQRFFEPHWDDVIHGRAALRDRLTPVLEGFSPQVTYDVFTRYWFMNDAFVNMPLLRELDDFRSRGLEVHLATVQEHERAGYLWNELGFQNHFDGIHYAAALGVSKPAPDFYRSVESAVDIEPDAIFFIDDKEVNVAAARECGWSAALWTGSDTLAELMHRQRWFPH